jgi:assimilatory nitrate reductase catalytic subunit
MYNIATGTNSFTQEDIEKYRSQSDPDNYPNTRFLDELFSRNGVQTAHTLTLNGGNDSHKYFLSGGILNQEGIIEKNNFKRYNFRLNLESDLGKNFTLNSRLFGSFEERNEPQATANKGGEMANQLIQKGWIDQQFIAKHTTGFDSFREHVATYSIARAEADCGIPGHDIEALVELIHQGKRVSFWWTMGVNQSHQGVRTAQAIINLALMTGNIGRPGTGANSITGQCNAMGSRLFSNTTNLLGGHDFGREEQRAKIAEILEIPVERIPTQASWSYDQIMDGIREGQIKGLWVIATNPAHSWIDQDEARRLLGKLDFLVVQDMYQSTETAQMADLLLPAAGWGEKEGTFINSERRIGLHKKVTRAPGQALADFYIFRLLAESWGCGHYFADWTTPEYVFRQMTRCSQGQPCDITGIRNYVMLDELRGIQWPWPASQKEDSLPPPERRLFEDGIFYHSDGKARFVFELPSPAAQEPSEAYPFRLLTGRGTAAQWHTQTKTSKSATLRKLYPATLFLQMHPDDARSHHLEEHDPVTVTSQRGSVQARVQLTRNVGRGNLFFPMHDSQVNRLTIAQFDPYSRQPSYKDTPVSVVKRPSAS